MVRDPQIGRYRRTRLFVPTLGYSRKCVRILVFRSSARIWAELHEQAFRRLTGCYFQISFSRFIVPLPLPLESDDSSEAPLADLVNAASSTPL